jgi:tight adherence protein C
MQILIIGLIFTSAGALAFGFLNMVFSEERQVTRVLRAVSRWEAEQAGEAEPLLRPFRSRVLMPFVSGAGTRLRGVFPAEVRARMERRLELAGGPAGLSADNVVAIQLVAAIAVPLLCLLVLSILGVGASLLSFAFVVAAAVGGYLAPVAWIEHVRTKRQNRIRRALPDMMDMLMISVEAGMGFDMALVKLVRNTAGPLAEEFGRMLSEVQSGGSRRDALRHLGERTEVQELDNFITAMVQADVFGVSVAGILQAQSLELRKKRRQLVEEQAQKAPVKMVFPTIFCMLPATMLVVLGPAVIAIGHTFGLIP